MAAKLSLRFVLVLVVTAAATIVLLAMFEAVIGARLSFGTALGVVLPLLMAARAAGGAWVRHQQGPAGVKAVLNYGAWFALLALAIYLIGGMGLRVWGGHDPAETARILVQSPLTMLGVTALAVATFALITGTGFALGARAQARLLPTFPG